LCAEPFGSDVQQRARTTVAKEKALQVSRAQMLPRAALQRVGKENSRPIGRPIHLQPCGGHRIIQHRFL